MNDSPQQNDENWQRELREHADMVAQQVSTTPPTLDRTRDIQAPEFGPRWPARIVAVAAASLVAIVPVTLLVMDRSDDAPAARSTAVERQPDDSVSPVIVTDTVHVDTGYSRALLPESVGAPTLQNGCLLLNPGGGLDMSVILWPPDTSWDAVHQQVELANGDIIVLGEEIMTAGPRLSYAIIEQAQPELAARLRQCMPDAPHDQIHIVPYDPSTVVASSPPIDTSPTDSSPTSQPPPDSPAPS